MILKDDFLSYKYGNSKAFNNLSSKFSLSIQSPQHYLLSTIYQDIYHKYDFHPISTKFHYQSKFGKGLDFQNTDQVSIFHDLLLVFW
jgi:hypothetical protein